MKKITYFDFEGCQSNLIKSETYYNNDRIHREDGPAVINYTAAGNIFDETYYRDNLKHRSDGPAYISYINDAVRMEGYYLNGRLRDKIYGPAVIHYRSDGSVKMEEYWRGGNFTRKFY